MSAQPPSPPGDPAGDASHLSGARLLAAAGFLGLAALVAVLAWKLNAAAPEARSENVELKQQLANMQEMLADLKKAEQLRLEEEQVRRSDIQAVSATAAEADEAVAAFERAAGAWDASTRELMATERGRPLAADPEGLARFRVLWTQDRPEAGAPAALRRRLEPLKAALDKAAASRDAAYSPGEELVDRVRGIRDDARRGAEAYGELNRRLAAVVAAAPAPASAAGPTLGEALEALERELAAEETAAIAAAVERERKDRAGKLAAEKAESERRITDAQVEAERARRDAEMKRLADEKGEAVARAEAEEAVRKAARERADLERRFQAALPEIQTLLSPFVTEGYTQPGRHYFEKATTKKMKVSYGKLKGSGMLEDTPQGVHKLVAAVVANRANDRPLGSFPAAMSNDFSAPWFVPGQRAQELLRELGPVLVEKGMLEP